MKKKQKCLLWKQLDWDVRVDMGDQLEGSGSVHKRYSDSLDKSSGREDIEKGMNSRDI